MVFLSTTGDVLTPEQQAAFEDYIRNGGGYVGIHSAADTEYDWAWYGGLVGAYFLSHPAPQDATLLVEDRTHESTAHLGDTWQRFDEWYDFRDNPRDRVHVLMSVDPATLVESQMPDDHPIAWCHDYDGGRAWYTALGHTANRGLNRRSSSMCWVASEPPPASRRPTVQHRSRPVTATTADDRAGTLRWQRLRTTTTTTTPTTTTATTASPSPASATSPFATTIGDHDDVPSGTPRGDGSAAPWVVLSVVAGIAAPWAMSRSRSCGDAGGPADRVDAERPAPAVRR